MLAEAFFYMIRYVSTWNQCSRSFRHYLLRLLCWSRFLALYYSYLLYYPYFPRQDQHHSHFVKLQCQNQYLGLAFSNLLCCFCTWKPSSFLAHLTKFAKPLFTSTGTITRWKYNQGLNIIRKIPSQLSIHFIFTCQRLHFPFMLSMWKLNED